MGNKRRRNGAISFALYDPNAKRRHIELITMPQNGSQSSSGTYSRLFYESLSSHSLPIVEHFRQTIRQRIAFQKLFLNYLFTISNSIRQEMGSRKLLVKRHDEFNRRSTAILGDIEKLI